MKRAVLAFSGGLDTCWCIPVLQELGYAVATVTVDVGGFGPSELEEIADRSVRLGAERHVVVSASDLYFDEVLRHLIAGNVVRGGLYPLCVGSERALQAREAACAARSLGAEAVAHGCTAAGNDQIRFEVALRTLAPDLAVLAPVRDRMPSRTDQLDLLRARGLQFPEDKARYSVNSGLWGVTIGGAETTATTESLPESAWIRTRGAYENPQPPSRHSIRFERGIPCALDGEGMPPVPLLQAADRLAAAYGIGRGIHLGETILGVKGRVAFEAPAATLILAAHRELEKLVLTKRQAALKDQVAALYGDWIHEGLFTEPASRMAEALLSESQARVTGQVVFELRPGSVFVTGVESPYSLHAASRAVYGEAAGEWTSQDAAGFGRLYGLAGELHARAGRAG